MRAKEIFNKSIVQEQLLAELKMNPSSLMAFAKSDDAEGIRAGFEAELVFSGWVDEKEPQLPKPHSFEDAINYFGGWGDIEGSKVGDWISEDISEWEYELFRRYGEDEAREWLEEEFDKDEFIQEYLEDDLDLTSEEVEAAIQNEDENYKKAEAAYEDEFEDQIRQLMKGNHDKQWEAVDYYREANAYDLSFEDWMEDRNIDDIGDIAYHANVSVPYEFAMRDNDEAHYVARNNLGERFEDHFGVPVQVSDSYHGADRDEETWIFEPDSSIEAEEGDLPVEIVSPPMPLEETLQKIKDVLEWAKSEGAYTNDSTGFHMSVSLPYFDQHNIDYLKLVLFLGDMHVLEQFGRDANAYTKSSFKNIKRGFVRTGVDDIFEKLRDSFQLAARDAVEVAKKNNIEKFVSVNDKADYVEFRSAGGNYIADVEKAQNALMRYARALKIASSPKEERVEYAKKLYRLLSDVREELGQDTDQLQLFVKYSTGLLPREVLKAQLQDRARNKK